MSADERMPPELSSFERTLAGLAPAPSRIDRDRLMYDLGAEAAEARLSAAGARGAAGAFLPPRVWAAAATLLACISLGLAARLAVELRGGDRQPLAAPSSELVLSPPAATSSPAMREKVEVTSASPLRERSPQMNADERWLMTVANPTTRANNLRRLNARSLRAARDAGEPIVVAEAALDSARATSAPDDGSSASRATLRWTDRQQWRDFLDTVN